MGGYRGTGYFVKNSAFAQKTWTVTLNRQIKIRQNLQAAVDHFYSGRADLAAELCKKVLKIDRKNPTALYLLGVVLHQTGDSERAARLIEKSLKVEPKNPDAQNYLGVVLATMKRHKDAAKRFQRAVSLNPDFAEAYNNLGNALKECGKLEDAISSFSSAIRLRPDYAEAYNGLGTANRELGKLENAEAALRKAIELDTAHTDARINLGHVMCDLGRHYEAAELYRQALDVDPDLSDAYQYLTSTLQTLSKPLGALETARQWTKVEPRSPRALWALADSLAAVEAYDEAITVYDDAFSASDDPVMRAILLTDISQLPGRLRNPVYLESIQTLLDKVPELAQMEPGIDFRCQLAMGRAAMLDKLGRQEEAWSEFMAANAQLDEKNHIDWQREKSVREAALQRALVWRESGLRQDNIDESLPISLFILGPSRSGKSSVERLAVSLEGVSSGFENSLISEVAGRVATRKTDFVADALSELEPGERDRFTREYGEAIRMMAGGHQVISNTHPYYVIDAGWIAELVPNARFILVERDRADNALRIFTKLYKAGTNFYAYNLAKVEDYLDWYTAMFDAWEAGLGGRVMRIRYEDAVSRPGEIRGRIAALCDIADGGLEVPVLADDRGAAKPYAAFMAQAVSSE